MSYCINNNVTNLWVSPYTYWTLYDNGLAPSLSPPKPGTCGTPASPAALRATMVDAPSATSRLCTATAAEYLTITGTANRDGSGGSCRRRTVGRLAAIGKVALEKLPRRSDFVHSNPHPPVTPRETRRCLQVWPSTCSPIWKAKDHINIMSFFAKRNENDMEIPRPLDPPSRPVSQPNQPPAGAAPVDASRLLPVTLPGRSNIGRTVTIKGDIQSDEDLQIEGQMEGRLDLGQHRLTIAPSGQVQASIVARDVDVHGIVKGNVLAAERVILRKDSKLIGDLKMASVVIEDGAYFKGSVDITQPHGAQANLLPKS
jgi:cytoskeletal protein CcmA (bactofilin family)